MDERTEAGGTSFGSPSAKNDEIGDGVLLTEKASSLRLSGVKGRKCSHPWEKSYTNAVRGKRRG